MKNYIFGDTGGHAAQLFGALKNIGVDFENYTIPEDVRIIHLGDLIHKGPSSAAVLVRVDKLIRNNPGQWIQILGNHEFQHIEGAPYFWRCACTLEDEIIINDWYDEGHAFPTWGLDSFKNIKLEVSNRPKFVIPQTGIFFSHAGLTYNWWKNTGQEKTSPSELADIINNEPVFSVTAAGELLFGPQHRSHNAGPVWAIGNTEVFDSWRAHPEADMPFLQFHGHTTSYRFSRGAWWNKNKSFAPFREASKLNPENRTVITQLNNNILVGIDPGYSNTADTKTQPYQLFES